MEFHKREKAVALRYDHLTDKAPMVAAKGQGEMAEIIKELAREHGIPIQEDKQLAEYLTALDLYEEIPPQLYLVVAEILAFVYRMNHKYESNFYYKNDDFENESNLDNDEEESAE